MSLNRGVFHNFQGELQNSCESKNGFVADEFRVKLSDPICTNPKGVDIGLFECSGCFIAPEHASPCGTQILFKWVFIC